MDSLIFRPAPTGTLVRLYARQETPIPGMYLYRVGRRIRHRGYLNRRLARYGFATMSNSTRSSFFTFTAPPPMLMGSIPKSLCFSCTEP